MYTRNHAVALTYPLFVTTITYTILTLTGNQHPQNIFSCFIFLKDFKKGIDLKNQLHRTQTYLCICDTQILAYGVCNIFCLLKLLNEWDFQIGLSSAEVRINPVLIGH